MNKPQKKESEPGSQPVPEGSEGSPTLEGSPSPNVSDPTPGGPDTTPPGDPAIDPVTDGETGFKNPFLTGKTPEQIDQMFGAMTAELRDTGVRENALTRELAEARRTPSQPETDLEELSVREPLTAMRMVMKQELGEMMAPFNEDLKNRAAMVAEQDLQSQFPDWLEISPLVDILIRQSGQERSAANLQALYYTAKGMRETGVFERYGYPTGGSATPAPVTPTPGAPAMSAPPQNRPSPAPLPTPRSGTQEIEELSEQERRIAKEWGMTLKDYVEFRDMDEASVASSDIGMEAVS